MPCPHPSKNKFMGLTPPTSRGEVVIHSDVMVRMRDGVHLATDIHVPARDGVPLPGSFPVVLERTPYDKTGIRVSERSALDPMPKTRQEIAAYFVKQGFVVVLQDCRGRYRSEGDFTKYIGDTEDGFDTLQWVVQQDWCNGKIGTFGLSYSAHTQTALISLQPPGLTSLFIDCGGFANAYRGGIRHGGAFELKQATWAFKNAQVSPAALDDPLILAALKAQNIEDWFKVMPWKRGHSPLQWVPEYEDYLFEQWEHGNFDDYWRQPELYAAGHYEKLRGIPVFLMCGWWDPYAQTTTDNYTGISRHSADTVSMVLGPWTHGQRSVSHAGDVDFGPNAVLDGAIAPDYLALRLQWFERTLKNNPAPPPPRVRYFRMGGGCGRRNAQGRLEHGGSWHSAPDWPLPNMVLTPYHLHPDGSLKTSLAQEVDTSRSYQFDPAQPVPTIGGSVTSGEPLMFAGAFDQRTNAQLFGAHAPFLPLAARADVLVFQTEVLTQDVEVTGPIVVRLWISSDAPDTDFTAKLIDVHPPTVDDPSGFAMNLTDGILRCRYRNSWEHPQWLIPGEVACIEIEPMPTSNVFLKGHRIRLDISSSNFPRFDVNPNTGEPEGRAQRQQVALNTVWMRPDRPSQIVLPIIPAQTTT